LPSKARFDEKSYVYRLSLSSINKYIQSFIIFSVKYILQKSHHGSMSKVYITHQIPQIGLDMLEGKVDYNINPHEGVASKAEIIEGLSGCDGLMCLLTDKIDAEIMDAAPLKVISNMAMGYNNIDVGAATERGIIVTNTPGVLSKSSADLAFALLLAAARRVVEGDSFMRSDRFAGWDPLLMLGSDIHGKTLGVVGAGAIGTEVLRRATGFSMKLLYHNRNRSEEAEALGAEYVTLDELLQKSDFVSLHIPLTEDTDNMLDRKRIYNMKKGAILINTARGEVIDEEALMDALTDGHIAAAGLDVYRGEPLGIDKRWYTTPNTVLAPHMASASFETRSKMTEIAVNNLINGIEGKNITNVINPEVLD
jgi:glyoxylate reductase